MCCRNDTPSGSGGLGSMRTTHGCDQKSMVASRSMDLYHPHMETTFAYPSAITDTRAVTLELSESQWRALREVEPDAIGWLHAQVRNRLASRTELSARPGVQPVDAAATDEY